MYQFDSRVSYSKIDEQGKLTLHGMIDYFQDCSTFHSEDVGQGFRILKEKQKAWVLLSWQIVIDRFPTFGERLTVETRAYGFRGFLGDRNFALLDEKGNRAVRANSLWVLLDTKTGKPTKIGGEYAAGYGLDEKLDMEYEPRKIALPQEMEEQEHFRVKRCHLDTNHHVNNGQYVQMALEYVPEGMELRQVRVEYRKSAYGGDLIVPMASWEKDAFVVALCDKEKKPYAVIEFMEKGKEKPGQERMKDVAVREKTGISCSKKNEIRDLSGRGGGCFQTCAAPEQGSAGGDRDRG